MSPRLGHIPARPTSPSTPQLKFVDKLVDYKGGATAAGSASVDATGGARGQTYVVPEFSKDAEWRKDPNRHRPLGFSWRMPSEELKAVLDLPVMDTPAEQDVVEAVTADAIVSAHLYPGRRVSYSRSEKHWVQRARYTGKGFVRATVTRVIDRLVAQGILLEHDRRPPGVRGVQSSYLPNPMLAAFEMPKLNKRRGESLILKDSEGNLIGYKDTPETCDRRFMLERVNAVLARTEFSIDGDAEMSEGRWKRIDDMLVSTTQTAMHRVYNGGWTLGGRFYGAFWMSMPGDDRKRILIDGNETTEVDYDQLHARIIYAWAKKKLVGDAYDIDGFERKVAKRAFFIIVNAKSYLSAKGAVAELLDEKGLDPKLADKLIEAMKDRHHQVSKYFHSGIGLELQNLDGRMAEYVLRVMTVQKGVPCLPIHDSFIVPAGQVKNLVRTMKAAYEKFVGRASSAVCSIKSAATSTSTKTTTYAQNSPHLPSSPSASSTEAKYRTPVIEESVFENLASVNRNTESAKNGKTESSIAREDAKAEQPVIKRTIPMPSFLREVQEQATKAWREDLARKQAKAGTRLRDRQMGYGGKVGSAVVRVAG